MSPVTFIVGDFVQVEEDDDVRVAFDSIQRAREVLSDDDVGEDVFPTLHSRVPHAVADDADGLQADRFSGYELLRPETQPGQESGQSIPEGHPYASLISPAICDRAGGIESLA
jgi:hypothetical protein